MNCRGMNWLPRHQDDRPVEADKPQRHYSQHFSKSWKQKPKWTMRGSDSGHIPMLIRCNIDPYRTVVRIVWAVSTNTHLVCRVASQQAQWYQNAAHALRSYRKTFQKKSSSKQIKMKIKPNTMHQVYGAMRWVLMYGYSQLQSVVSIYWELRSVNI